MAAFHGPRKIVYFLHGICYTGFVNTYRICRSGSPAVLASRRISQLLKLIDSREATSQAAMLAWALALFRADGWVIGMVSLLSIFHWGAGTVVFRVLEKRL